MKTITINNKITYHNCTDITFDVIYRMFQCSDPAVAYGNWLKFKTGNTGTLEGKSVEVIGTFSAIIED